MTRWTVLSLSFIVLITILFKPNYSFAEEVSKSKVIFLNDDFYAATNSLKWNNLTIDFSNYHPFGRLALAAVNPENFNSLPGNVLGEVIKWQFLNDQPIELIEITASVENPEGKNLHVFLNTNGIWQKTSSQQIGKNKISFHIQSLKGSFLITSSQVKSDESFYELPLDTTTLKKGYTFATPDNSVRIGFMPNLVDKPFVAKVRNLPNFYGAADLPENLKFASEIYHIWLDSPENLNLSKPVPVEIKFFSGNDELKNIYYYNPAEKKWYLSPSTTRYEDGVVRTLTYNQEYILAVVADPAIKERGEASWFSSSLTPRNPYGAANNDYPLGTIVRVTNLENGKFFDTKIISRGPYVDFRIIDLASNAFKKIANLSEGVIDVKIEPLYALPK